jgi:hypothetical protein|tara:strand:+ start:36 stop:416 length:381 start_codon:yes stop_codon:yes gene_type:complete
MVTMTPDEEVEFWLYVFKVVGALVVAWLSASAFKARKKALRNRLNILFSDTDIIETKQFITRENEKIERLGVIRKQEERLEFEFFEDGLQKDYRAFGKLDELEKYLQENTCFRLGDFARPITITGS